MIANWSKLENEMEMLIWKMGRLDDEDGRILTARLDANSKIQKLRALGNRHFQIDPNQLAAFLDLLLTIDDMKDDRNFVIHGTWGVLMPENVPFVTSMRPTTEIGQTHGETFPEARMKALIENIKLAQQFVRRQGDALDTLRRKLPERSHP